MRSGKRNVMICVVSLSAMLIAASGAHAKPMQDKQDVLLVSTQESFSPSIRVKVNADDVNLRCKPNVEAQIVTTLKKGTIVEVEQKLDNWCKVSYGRHFGYVSTEYLDLPVEVKESEYAILTMGMNSAEVLRLQETLAEKGYYNGRCNGTYGAKTREAVRKFQQDNGLNADGVADAQTQKVLYK